MTTVRRDHGATLVEMLISIVLLGTVGVAVLAAMSAAITLGEPQERALAQRLLTYPTAVAEALAGYAPHKLCTYLFDLAQDFTAFYEHCPVMQAAEPVRSSRLALCDVTARTLAHGLGLLGIDAPQAM